MKRPIGFLAEHHSEEQPEQIAPARSDTPVKSLVHVRFRDTSQELAYYNHRFDLRVGDVVYVSGTKRQSPGVVTRLTTRFRIHTADYEQVLAVLELGIHGHYTRFGDKMVSFGAQAVTAEQFERWITPPAEEKAKDDAPDELVSGEGYEIDLNNIGLCPDLTDAVAQRASGYCAEGRVRYLSLRNGQGVAFVEGKRWYRVDFTLNEGPMQEVFCDCPCPGLCKHEVAVALTLRMLHRQPGFRMGEDCTVLDSAVFWKLAARADSVDL